MAATKYIKPYVEHGEKAGAVRKITVSIPLHVLRLLSDERTRRQVSNLRHATNSDLLVEAFLHAFTGQELPKDADLRRVPASPATKASSKKAAPAKKPAAKKPAAKKPAARKVSAKAAPAAKATKATKSTKVTKSTAAKKPAAKKTAAVKPAAAKATRARATAVKSKKK